MRGNQMKCLILVINFNRAAVYDPHEYLKANYNYPFPMGLAYISAVLKKNGHEVKILNLNHCNGTTDEIIKTELSKEYFDLVITGSISPFFPDIRTCVETVRKYAPKTRIIIGGGMVSSQPEIIFKLLEPDFAVIGEGEYTLKELFECLEKQEDVNKVDGILYRNSDGQIVFTNPRTPIEELDSLPYPDFDGFGFWEILDNLTSNSNDVFDFPRTYQIVASRSCPYKCTFCFHPLGNKYRQRSVEKILEEIEYAIKKYRINYFSIVDELFSHDQKRVYNFCSKLKKIQEMVPWELKWSCQMRVDIFDEEMVKTMKDAGCHFFSLGLESYSPIVLKSMRKVTTPQQIDRALRLCVQNKISLQGVFIFGDIAETNETYCETLKYWETNCGSTWSGVFLGFIQIYQGSEIYRHAVKKGIIKDEIEFIENRAKISIRNVEINFTDNMTDKEYELMKLDVLCAGLCPKQYTKPLINKQEDNFHEVHVKCPYCKEISIYKNYILPENFSRVKITCRKCGGRYDIVSMKETIKIKIIMTIFKIFGSRTIYYPIYYLRKSRAFNIFFGPFLRMLVWSQK
jgi:radical SAM superfamily enzyme YgiQ (UPF0313 family)